MLSRLDGLHRKQILDCNALPETLSLYYSRGWHYFLLSIFAPPLAFYIYFFAISHVNVLTAVFALPAFFLARVCFDCVRALRWHGPVLILDSFGITDYRQGNEAVPWRYVVNAQLGANDAFTFLTLRFRSAELAKRYMGARKFYESWLHDWFMAGQWRTCLTPLAFKRREVFQRANEFIARERTA